MQQQTFQPTDAQVFAALEALADQPQDLGTVARAMGVQRGADSMLVKLINRGLVRRWQKSSWYGQGFAITDAGRALLEAERRESTERVEREAVEHGWEARTARPQPPTPPTAIDVVVLPRLPFGSAHARQALLEPSR